MKKTNKLYIHVCEGADGEYLSGKKREMTEDSALQANKSLANVDDGGYWVLAETFDAAAPSTPVNDKQEQTVEGFTPGEWTFKKIGKALFIGLNGYPEKVRDDNHTGYIAEIRKATEFFDITQQDEANAALICAAPNLYRDNAQLKEQVKLLREALDKAKDWFYVHGKNGKIYADGVKPACIAWIESALKQTELKQ